MSSDKPAEKRPEICNSGRALHFDEPPERGFAMITTIVVAALLVCCVSVVVVKPLSKIIGGLLITIGQWLQGGAPGS